MEEIVRATPTGAYARRLWFLYEWLLGERLALPDAAGGSYAPVVDPRHQWAGEGQPVSRQRVRNNLPGTPQFCPLVFRTEALEAFVARNLHHRAQEASAAVPRDLLARTAAFLLLKDSQSSYVIEGEQPPHDRIQRWGRAIGEAGRQPLDEAELLRLHRIVIGTDRFVRLGLRTEGGFVGEHDRTTGHPLPDHISTRPQDLASLISGLIAFSGPTSAALDPVIAAACLAFGFVYIHPFEDGNGRLHRYLIHHTLARRGFNPPGMVFPVSAVFLERIDTYRQVLESLSHRLLPLIDWRATPNNNVEVANDTADFYRFFDATPQAEFLYACVEKTIEHDLPAEADFLRRYDLFRREVQTVADMPERLLDLLFRFLHQNKGRFSHRAADKEFAALTPEERQRVEAAYHQAFGEGPNPHALP